MSMQNEKGKWAISTSKKGNEMQQNDMEKARFRRENTKVVQSCPVVSLQRETHETM